jgi:hypothetical protein
MSILGWRPYSIPALVEECMCLDISVLRRNAYFNHKGLAKFSRSWKWPNGDITKATLDVRMDDEKYGPHLMLRIDGGQEQLIFLERTQPNFGGERLWFICLTGKRCRKLYLAHGTTHVLCREALHLSYESQYRDHVWRLNERARQLRARLGVVDRSPTLPGKPKGMWRRTYQKLVCRVADAEDDALQARLEWMRRRYGSQGNPDWVRG